jgi:broad specificity phosphatase PhoE
MSWTFITHPEVVIDPAVPIREWALSPAGRARAALTANMLPGINRIVSSAERKALDTAEVLAGALNVDMTVDPDLGEMDRSATGYLEPAEFDETVDLFFARPHESVRAWERALDAQRRVEDAVRGHASGARDGGVAFVAHGGVGALLLASLTLAPISRSFDQPGMGSYFTFDPHTWRTLSTWQRIR